MADIAALFDDALYPVELKHPVTKEPVGITMWIAPFEADATADWWVRTQAQLARIRAGEGDISGDRMAEIDAQSLVKRCIASVRKWDWNGNSFGALGADPACTVENRIAVLTHPASSWIVDQVFLAGATLANFTKKPEPN